MLKDDTGLIEKKVDARIKYPCYKSFDEIIDLEELKSLDSYITERIEHHIQTEKDSFFWNQYRLDSDAPDKPGVREIWLTKTKPGVPYNYQDLNKPELWQPTEAADEFSDVMRFVSRLPFKATGRILIIYDNTGAEVPAHRDHLQTDICHEFLWFRTNKNKPFYMLNHKTGEKLYVDSYSAWFDSVNQFHGSNAGKGLSFSFRVDGVFSDELRKQIPKPEFNYASMPALWSYI
ncbi:MAG TPA: hypothetical protein VF596_14200 [Pyrinomonadaceae bacterium]|jgi:hypothetical protein